MSYIYSPAKNRRSGSTMQKMPKRGALVRDAAKEALPGYPKEDQFKCEEAIRDYLKGDKIACLLCGKFYYQLSPHIARIHDVDAQAYKARYGIPQHYGLTGEAKRTAASERGRSAENIAHLRKAAEKSYTTITRGECKRTKFAPVTRQSFSARVNQPGIERKTYNDFSWHLIVMASIWKHETVTPPDGCASWSGFKKRWLHDSTLKAAVGASRKLFRSGVKARAKAVRDIGRVSV